MRAGASLMRVGACGAWSAIPGGLSDSHMAIANAAPKDSCKRMLVVAGDHGSAPRLAGRPEHVNSARTANLLRSIPGRWANDQHVGAFDDKLALLRIASLLV